MDWGFTGFGNRVLEFPESGTQVDVSPAGRARLRYNDVLDRLEQSLDGAAYVPLGGSMAGPWDLTGTTVHTDNSNWDVVCGANVMSGGGEKFRVTGGDTRLEGGLSVTGGVIDLDPTGSFSLDMDSGQPIDIQLGGGGGSDLSVLDSGGNQMLRVSEQNTVIEVGDVSEDWDFLFSGGGNFTIGTSAGNENSVRIYRSNSDPTPAADMGQVYTKDVSATAELFYEDENGNVTQIAGDYRFAVGANHVIEIGQAAADTQGDQLYIQPGTGGNSTTGNGGQGGRLWGRSGPGGNTTNSGSTGGQGGILELWAGYGGQVTAAAGTGGTGGVVHLYGGEGGFGSGGADGGDGGQTSVQGGVGGGAAGGGTAGDGGDVVVRGGGSTQTGGDATIDGGSGGVADGDVNIGAASTNAINIGNAVDNPAVNFLSTTTVEFGGDIEPNADISFPEGIHNLEIAPSTGVGVIGGNMNLEAGDGSASGVGAGGAGGTMNIDAGTGGNTTFAASTGGVGGAVVLGGGTGGNINAGSGTGGAGGATNLQAGTGGQGAGGANAGAGGSVNIDAGTGGTAAGGGTVGAGGNVIINGGAAGGLGAPNGNVNIGDSANTAQVNIGRAGGSLGFFGIGPVTRPNITGALSAVTDANAAAVLTSIISALTALGLATDGTT
jgi:hypothetical protein